MKDHLAKFVDENFVRDPFGFCSHGALLRCYDDFCALHGVVHRKLPALVLLLELEQRFGAKAKLTFITADRTRVVPGVSERADGSRPSKVYVVVGLRFKHISLNVRPSPDSNVPPSRVWKGVASGSILDRIEAPELPTPFDDDALP